MKRIAPVVEGHGDKAALPILLRRLAHDHGVYDLVVDPPIRVKRQRISRPDFDDLDKAVALIQKRPVDSILILIDADDDCPATLGPDLLRRAAVLAAHIPASAVLANREYEAWLLAGAESLVSAGALGPEVEYIGDPESEANPKAKLKSLLRGRYSETVDQPSLTSAVDLSQARANSRSFDKLCRDFEAVILA